MQTCQVTAQTLHYMPPLRCQYSRSAARNLFIAVVTGGCHYLPFFLWDFLTGCELTRALSHLKYSTHVQAVTVSVLPLDTLIEAIVIERHRGCGTNLPSKLTVCQPEAIKPHSQPTLFS